MKNRIVQRLMVLALAMAVLCAAAGTTLAESYTATTMRLLHCQGTVEIEDAAGQPRFVMENVRFSSGEAMRTGQDGMASVGLDDTKILTMDAASRVEFIKQSNAMKLTLTDGRLLLDVEQKLAEDETLDIETSTMVIGVRGTVLAVSDLEVSDVRAASEAEALALPETGRISSLTVLEGVTVLTYRDEQGEERTLEVSAGQKALLPDADADGLADAPPYVTAVSGEDLPGFALIQLAQNPPLADRIQTAIGFVSPSIFDLPIQLTAASAGKVYDGTPLTATHVEVEGLPVGFTCEATATGSRTAAGTGANPVGEYTIYGPEREDVTEYFTHVRTVDGTLSVSRARVTVWTGSASKVYDGTPLTEPEAGLRWAPLNGDYDRSLACVVTGSDGTQTLYGLCGNVWVHGTNPFTGETLDIELRAGDKLQIFLCEENGRKAISCTKTAISETECPEDVLRLYADNPEILSQACGETDWDEDVLREAIAGLPQSDAPAFREDGVLVRGDAADLLQDFTYVQITIEQTISGHSSRSLNRSEACYSRPGDNSPITVTATGSQTEIGESENTCKIDWGGENASDYIVDEEPGTLTVLAQTVTLTAASASKVYDGTPLRNNTVRCEGLPDGYYVRASVSGSQTEAGSSPNRVTSYRFFNSSDEDVTELYTDVVKVNGTLRVEPLALDLNCGGSAVTYGEAASDPVPSITYLNGAHAGETISGLRTRALSMLFRFNLFMGTPVDVSITDSGSGAGSHTLTGSVSYPAGGEGNFSVRMSGQAMTVAPRPLTVTTGSAGKVYDGQPLTSTEAYLTGLAAGDTVTVTANGSLTVVGTAVNTYTIDWGSVDPANYTLTENLGTLAVTANDSPIVITAGSADQYYNGRPLRNPATMISGLPGGFSYSAVPDGSQTDAGTGANTISSWTILSPDGEDATAFFSNVTTVSGTLTVLPVQLTITTGSAKKPYDGTPLTSGEISVSGLAEGEHPTVTATGSITDVGTAENSYAIAWGSVNPANYILTEEIGRLQVTLNDNPVTITSGSASMRYQGGRALKDGSYTVSGLPDGIGYWVSVTGQQWTVGESPNTISGYGFSKDGRDVTSFFSNISVVEGTLTVDKAIVTIWSDDATKVYDGKPLDSTIHCTGIFGADNSVNGILIYRSVSLTDAGSIQDSFTVVWNYPELEPLYEIETLPGTLTVTPATLTVTTGSATKVYDGTPLTNPEAQCTGMVNGETASATGIGSITDAGSASNGYAIEWGAGAKPGNYTVAFKPGVLTVTPAALTVSTGSASKAYDNTPLTSGDNSVSGLIGSDTISVIVTGSLTNVGTADNTFTIDWGATNPDNYSVSENPGTLSVTPTDNPITIIADSASKPFDGQALTANGVTGAGLPAGLSVQGTASGSQTVMGVANNEVTSWTITNGAGENVSSYFTNVSYTSGDLTVYANSTPITITGPTITLTYSGQEISVPSLCSCTGLPAGFSLTADASGSRKDAGTTELVIHSYSITYPGLGDVSYCFEKVTTNSGSLTILPAQLVIITGSASKTYDGVPLTNSEYTVSGLKGNEQIFCNVTGYQEHAGSSENTCMISDWGTADPGNYSVSYDFGTLTVEKATLTITTGSAVGLLENAPITADYAHADGLASGETVVVTATGVGSELGTITNTYDLQWGTANSGDYTIAENLGTITVVEEAIVIPGD